MANSNNSTHTAAQRPAQDDRVRQAVTLILKRLKRGQTVVLPGLGSLIPGAPPIFESAAAPAGRKSKVREKTTDEDR